MVDQELMTATDNLVGEITQVDVVSLATGASGIGTGLFSADFVAQLVGGMLAGQRNAVRFIGEILAKAGVTGAFILARRMGGELMSVFFGLAAVGASVSTLLQFIEAIAETGARIVTGELAVQGSGEQETTSESASVDDSGFGDSGGGAEITV